ncbi:hypothetical protein SP21_65 [Salmonella phage 21]|nr:hypothetical protein SP21_65 [Salmonella phage 21]
MIEGGSPWLRYTILTCIRDVMDRCRCELWTLGCAGFQVWLNVSVHHSVREPVTSAEFLIFAVLSDFAAILPFGAWLNDNLDLFFSTFEGKAIIRNHVIVQSKF